MSVIDEIAAERRRQIDVEGWTFEHDDRHRMGEIAEAAACYALPWSRRNQARNAYDQRSIREWLWPWSEAWWKPKTRRRDLIRAAALIVAEIERMDRFLSPPATEPGHD